MPRQLALSVAASALFATVLSPSASRADSLTDQNPVSVTVSLQGLDLNTAAGAREALTRISNAARSGCGIENEFNALLTAKFQICYRDALSAAVQSLNHPLLTQTFAERFPRYAASEGVVVHSPLTADSK